MKVERSERPILVAVDFSEHAAAALEWAASEALVHGVPISVLHVVHDPQDAPGSYRVDDENAPPSERIEDAAHRLVETFLADVRSRNDDVARLPDIVPMVVIGIPATRIIEVAERISARHVVLGSRGRTGIKHLLLGSTAERVARLAKVPVTIVKLDDPDDASDDDELHSA